MRRTPVTVTDTQLFFTYFSRKGTMEIHRQAAMILNGTLVLIDENLVPIISKLNRHGLETIFSCQGGRKKLSYGYLDQGYVSFKNKLMKKDRKKVEKLLGLSGKVPVFICTKKGLEVDEPKLPYWEYYTESKRLAIRFKKV